VTFDNPVRITVPGKLKGKQRQRCTRVHFKGEWRECCEVVCYGLAVLRHDPASPYGLGAHTWVEAPGADLFDTDRAFMCSVGPDGWSDEPFEVRYLDDELYADA
jgi:hypothetical protein